jgi:hypothetical protein
MTVLRFALALIISVMFLAAACGGEDEGAGPDGSAPSLSPEEARDAALAFAAEFRFPDASLDDLVWETTDLTPPGLVGAANLQYDAEGWRVLVSYSVVAQPTYGVGIQRLDTGEDWKGRVTDKDEVEETGFIAADGAASLQGVLSAFPEGEEFDDLLVTDDSQEYGIEPVTSDAEAAIPELIKQAVRVTVVGQLVTGVDDVEGRRIEVESIKATVPMPTIAAE